jgi:hypothetical protein
MPTGFFVEHGTEAQPYHTPAYLKRSKQERASLQIKYGSVLILMASRDR